MIFYQLSLVLEKQGHKKDYINKITCLLKRIELYNGKVERTKIIELIDNKSNLLTFLKLKKIS